MEPLLERGCHLLAGVASVIDNMTYPTMALYFGGNRYIVTYEIFCHSNNTQARGRKRRLAELSLIPDFGELLT